MQRHSLVTAQDSAQLSLTLLEFAAGAANALNTHSQDQLIAVASGTGMVATESEVHEVSADDVAFFAAGERHWHAACAACGVSFTPKGTTTAVV